MASDGNFWIPEYNGSNGRGDVIKLSPSSGKVLKTFSFSAMSPAGTHPGRLIQASDGISWGTTAYGGAGPNREFGAGVVYELNAGTARAIAHPDSAGVV